MGLSRQEYWSGMPYPSPGDLPDSGIEPGSPALQADSLTSEPLGKPMYMYIHRHVRTHIYTHRAAKIRISFFLQQYRNFYQLFSKSANSNNALITHTIPNTQTSNQYQLQGQGGLACCDSWGRRVRHDWATELNWTEHFCCAVFLIYG